MSGKPLQGLSAAALRALLELFGEMGEVAADAADPLAWRRHLAERLADALHCRLALVTDIHQASAEGPPQLADVVDTGWDGDAERTAFLAYLEDDHAEDPMLVRHAQDEGEVTAHERRDLIRNDAWYRNHHVMAYRRAARVDSCIYASARLRRGHAVSLGLHRAWGDRPFDARDRRFAHAVQAMLQGWYRVLLAPPEPRMPPGLAPRHERVLRGLLEGKSEKEVAVATGLRPSTVHEYVKQMHRRLGVSSRAELFARCYAPDAGQP